MLFIDAYNRLSYNYGNGSNKNYAFFCTFISSTEKEEKVNNLSFQKYLIDIKSYKSKSASDVVIWN